MNSIRSNAWRFAFVASGVLLVAGGRMHPDADPKQSVKDELAEMAADDRWVAAHSLMALSTLLLAIGLWMAHRSRSWPSRTHGPLELAAVAVALYFVETVFHLAAKVDVGAIRDGDAAPIAVTHIVLSAVLYPLSGAAIAFLAGRLLLSLRSPRWLIAVPGVAGGVLHAVSVPLVMLFPDSELSVAFVGGAVLIAVWSVLTGLVGVGERVPVLEPAVAVGV
jgi:hypothetical protein